MKYCQYCGTQMEDAATVCPQCQQPTAYVPQPPAPQQPPIPQQPMSYQQPPYQPQQMPYYQPYVKPESSALSICAIVFAFVAPLVGLILGIIGVCVHKVEEHKKRSRLAIIFAGGMMLLGIILAVVIVVSTMNMMTDVITEFPYDSFPYDQFAYNF